MKSLRKRKNIGTSEEEGEKKMTVSVNFWLLMDFLELKIAVLSESKITYFFLQASRLLSRYGRQVFKLLSQLVQRFGNVCSKN